MTRNQKIKDLKVASMLSKMMQSKNHTDILADYYKRLRIPSAGKYARKMKKLYKMVFN